MKSPLVLFKEAANLLWKHKGFFIKQSLLLMLIGLLTIAPLALILAIVMTTKNLWVILPITIFASVFFVYISTVLTIVKELVAYQVGADKPKTFGELFKHARTLVVPYLISIILTCLLVLVGFVLLAIPGVIAAVYLSFVMQAVIVSGVSGVNSLSYSYNLIKNRWWKTVWYFLSVATIPFLLQLAAGFGSAVLGEDYQVLFTLPLSIINAIFGAIYAVYIYLVYAEFLKHKTK